MGKNARMIEIVRQASSLAIAKRTTEEHEKTAALKAIRHLESAKKGKARLEMRLMRRASSSKLITGKPGEKETDNEIKLEKKGGQVEGKEKEENQRGRKRKRKCQ